MVQALQETQHYLKHRGLQKEVQQLQERITVLSVQVLQQRQVVRSDLLLHCLLTQVVVELYRVCFRA